MPSLMRRSAAFSSLSQPIVNWSVEKRRNRIQIRKLVIEVVSEGILTGGGGEVKEFSSAGVVGRFGGCWGNPANGIRNWVAAMTPAAMSNDGMTKECRRTKS